MKNIFIFFILFFSNLSFSQQDFTKIEIKAQPITDSIFMLTGEGGNMAISIGEDGSFLIDDQFSRLTKKIIADITKLGGQTPKFMINTHWHYDHTGGNENLGKAGTVIVAHDNVRKRMSVDSVITAFNANIPASPKVALPVITFSTDTTLHFNDEKIRATHISNAHTDGDAIVFFEKANVLHTGDIYFNGFYPFIDTDHGGSLSGMAKAVELILPMINEKTIIIPGHGKLSNKKELSEYGAMLNVMAKKIDALKDQGKSVDEIVAAKPSAEFDVKWGNGFLKPDQWVGIISQ